jgi:hypothetical protein
VQRIGAIETPTPPVGQTQRVIGLVLGGAGVTAMVVGVIASILAKEKYDASTQGCIGNVCSTGSGVDDRVSAMRLATAATISLGAGALATVAGTIVFFTAPKARASGLSVGFGPITQGGGLSVGGRF